MIDEETIEDLYLVSIVYVDGLSAVVNEFNSIDRLEASVESSTKVERRTLCQNPDNFAEITRLTICSSGVL